MAAQRMSGCPPPRMPVSSAMIAKVGAAARPSQSATRRALSERMAPTSFLLANEDTVASWYGRETLRPDHRAAVGAVCSTFFLVGVALAGRDQAAQAFIDIVTPRARAFAVAFDGWNETEMSEAQLGLGALPCDLK